MTFANEKKMYLSKQDKSKKGEIDERVIPLLNIINSRDNYYTTSSCSGRIYLWTGTGKKNQTEWIKVSHDLIAENFFDFKPRPDVVWLRLEPFILHVACKDLTSANALLEKARTIYKKSCLLSASNKILVEIRGSETIEMPLDHNGKLLFSGEWSWLINLLNKKMQKIWEGTEKFRQAIT